ncbi:tripartite tricarboxylate transporter substrate binding protein [Alcaligenaceae bacterium]|nr:tripartite tricarboxylate transporter substrate binding protein [Alcaligenaceae bacterium]
MPRINLTRRSMILSALCAPAIPAWANTNRPPLRLLIPADPGSGLDTFARIIQPELTNALGQTVVIENSASAGGTVSTSRLVRSAPDGNTVSLVSNNHVVNPSIYPKLPYDALDDITPISLLGTLPLVLVATPNLPVNNAKELAGYINAQPAGSQNFASSGHGTIIHLVGQMFVDSAKMDIVHVPYNGVSPQMQAIANGEAQFGVVALPAVQGFLDSGMVRAVALTGRPSVPNLPGILPLADSGFDDIDVSAWFTLIGPAKLPTSEVSRLVEGFRSAVSVPKVKEALARQQNIINPGSAEDAAKFLRAEHDRYADIVKSAGIKPE